MPTIATILNNYYNHKTTKAHYPIDDPSVTDLEKSTTEARAELGANKSGHRAFQFTDWQVLPFVLTFMSAKI